MENYLILFLVFLITFIVVHLLLKPSNKGKGPWSIPFLGHLPLLGSSPGEVLQSLAKKYGDVFTVNAYGKDYVVLNSYSLVNEAFIKQKDNFSGRPDSFPFQKFFFKDVAVNVIEGADFTRIKTLLLNTMSDLGVGRSGFEPIIHDIVEKMLAYISKFNGKPANISTILSNSTANVTSEWLFSQQFDIEDKNFEGFYEGLNRTLALTEGFKMHFIGPLYKYAF